MRLPDMPTLPIETYQLFVKFLNKRIEAQKREPKNLLLTEDSVRYSFFHALLQTMTDIEQDEIILEFSHPHPEFVGKKIDTYIQAAAKRPELFIEFKFHRESGSASPTPQKAGTLFKDFSRLSSIKSERSRCLVIYLTDPEMVKYFTKNKDDNSAFWHEPINGSFSYDDEFIKNKAKTFKTASGDLHGAKVRVEFRADLAEDHHLRVFEINKI
jgi:hypothetical protein